MSTKLRVTLFLPQTMLEEIRAEANRLDRTISWVVQTSWRFARNRVGQLAPRPTEVQAPMDQRE